jgi:hypothetical protein
MKKSILLLVSILMVSLSGIYAQKSSKSYLTSGPELIFSFAQIDNNGDESGNVMRFSAFFHLQGFYNYDFNNTVGLFTGLALRNVGFIYNTQEPGQKKKYRTYNIGIPVGFKLGSMAGTHFFAGYELEFPINYKEKTFNNERKDDKFNVWFSDRVPVIYNTVLFGVQFPYGLNLKFKYYLTNFFNQDYSEVNTDGVTVYPYANMDAQIFYFSLSFNLSERMYLKYID